MTPLKVCQCADCNNVFETSGARRFCSSKCRQQAYRNRNRLVSPSDKFIKKNCRNCGKIYWTHIKSREYCSERCKQQHYRERKKMAKGGQQ